jgi:hypothetical protein
VRAAADRGARATSRSVGGVDIPTKEVVMRTQLRAGALTLAFLGSVGFALAQAPGQQGAQQEKLNLNQSKERSVSEGLKGEQAQSSPGYRGEVGSKPPESLQKKQVPGDVQAQVPETKGYFYIKLPDRIVLIDPDSQLVAEIIAVPATTGGPGSADQPRPAPGGPAR